MQGHAPACPRRCAPAAVLLPALTPLYSNLVWCCACIVVCALAAQPAADDLSGPSTVFGVGFGVVLLV
jgi:hypothetical protein